MLFALLIACSALGGGDDNVCEQWTTRKAGECREQVTEAILTAPPTDPNRPVARGQPFTLRDQCELFPERKALVVECVEKPTCDAFAACVVTLGDDIFYPPASPNLCSGFVARGGSKAVGERCAADEGVKAKVADCMMVLDDEFEGCAATIGS